MLKLSRLLVCILFLINCNFARATWYSENIENGADIIMMDLRWPWWPSGTYYANWNSGFNPKPNNLSFYAGFTSTVPDGPGSMPNPDEKLQSAFQPGSVWSFWGGNKAGTPVRFIDAAPNLFLKNIYGGEGLSATLGAETWPFIKSQRWYTMLARVWQPTGGGDYGYVGRWIKDQASGHWHMIALARLPVPVTSFTGNSGFIEPLTSEKAVRSLHRRLGYYRKDAQWAKSDTISIDKTEYVVVNTLAEGDHEFAAIEYSQRPDLIPLKLAGKPLAGDQKHSFTVKQPDRPTLDQPAVSNVQASSSGSQILVSWEVPATASPAFAYQIEVFDNPACNGTPKTVVTEAMPNQRQALVAVDRAYPTVRFTLKDVFDQSTKPVVASVKPMGKPVAVPSMDNTIPGLAYELYHQDKQRKENYFESVVSKPNEQHRWLKLAELEQGKLVRQGLARGFDIDVREQRDAGYALVFKGFLRVPADGVYLLKAQIDGGYRIELNGTIALEWDGQHGSTEKAAGHYLSKGDHPLKVTYLYDQLPAKNFEISWEGPNLPRQPIPLEALRVADAGAYPSTKLTSIAPGDGTGKVTVTVDAKGHTIKQTLLFLGKLQIASGTGDTVEYNGPLPAGTNTFWARVLFDDNRTVDSATSELTVTGRVVEAPWTLNNVGDTLASAGLWQTGPKAFRFFGNGMHTVTQRIKGDFTATCRIDEYNGSKGEPVNRRAWVGLTAREHGEKRNWEWGQDFHLVQTAAEGIRASADFTDFGAGRITSYELPKGRPWLRIVRQGNVWTGWTSLDGKQWELGAYQFRKTAPEMDVGLFFSALPQEARAHYHASVSEFSVQPTVLPETPLPTPISATKTDGDRLTGVVISRSDPQTVVVRSTSKGIIKTTDGGKTWSSANGNLTGNGLAVRSVAIHPKQPLTMIAACGRGTNGELWKTTDGGKSWSKLNFTGDFDGSGPSALCGEIVAFDLKNPDTIYVGCESLGCFKSLDAGTTWTSLGLAGERITSIVVWPWEKHYPAPAKGKSHLCVTTCPDAWMKFLGRGEPSVATKAATSRSYVSHDNVKTLTLSDERIDTGFYNLAFDKAMQSTNEMRYATSHGYQTQVFSGAIMALYPPQKDLEWLRPTTAIAAAAMGDQKFGRCLTQALDPEVTGRISRSERWAFEWNWVKPKGSPSAGGLIAVSGDESHGQQWWFVYTDGLYFSEDGGNTLAKVLDHQGQR